MPWTVRLPFDKKFILIARRQRHYYKMCQQREVTELLEGGDSLGVNLLRIQSRSTKMLGRQLADATLQITTEKYT